MQTPTSRLASQRLLLLGLFHLAALEQTDATRGLVAAFQAVLDLLQSAYGNTQLALIALVAPRVAASFSEAALEQTLRTLMMRAQALDNSAGGGRVKAALFPDRFNAVIGAARRAQVDSARAVRERLAQQPAAASLRAEMLPLIDAAIADLVAKLDAWDASERALEAARAAELGAREAFVEAYYRQAGALQQLFGADRVRIELYFDAVQVRRAKKADEPGSAPPA